METNFIEIKVNGEKQWVAVKMGDWRTRQTTPKSYKKIGQFFHSEHKDFGKVNLITIYRNKRGKFIYKLIADGFYWPIYGKIECEYLENYKPIRKDQKNKLT